MASGTLTSRVLGLFRDVAMGALFDRAITDAWTAAFRLPNLFRRLLGEGSLGVGFIPVFIEAQKEDSSGTSARQLANAVYSLLLILLATVSLLGIVFIEPLFRSLLSETYAQDSEKWLLTLRMGRVMLGFVFFIGIYAYFMGILNAVGSFAWPTFAAALLNVSMLIFTFLPPWWFPYPGEGLAWGVLVGGVLQALVLGVVLYQKNYLPRWIWRSWRHPQVREVAGRVGAGLIGLGLLQFSTLIHLYFASSLPEGTISAIYWADRLLEFPLSLISVSLGAALLPQLSQYAAEGKHFEFQQAAEESLLMSLFLSIPACLGLFFLAEIIVEVLFLRGHFTATDVTNTATVLKIYALSLIFISTSRVIMPLYHARKNTWYPMILTAVALSLHVILAPFFMRSWGLRGLMLAGLFGLFVNATMLLLGLMRWPGALDFKKLGPPLAKFLLCAGALSLWLSGESHVVKLFGGRGVGSLILLMSVSVGIYFGLAAWLGCDQFFKIRPLISPGGDKKKKPPLGGGSF